MSQNPPAPEWIVSICRDFAPNALELAECFLYAGLVLGIITAIAEAAAAFQVSSRSGLRDERVTPTGLQAVVAALTSLLTALKDAKAWLALVITGLLLLWIAASAPDLCLPDEYRPRPTAAPQGQNLNANRDPGQSTAGSGGSSGSNAAGQTPAPGQRPQPAPPAGR